MNASGFGARDSRNRLTHPSTSELRLRTLPFSALAFGQSLESDSSALATSALGRLPGAFKETVKGSILTFPIRYRTLPYHRGTSGERTYVQSNVNLTKVANLGPSAPRRLLSGLHSPPFSRSPRPRPVSFLLVSPYSFLGPIFRPVSVYLSWDSDCAIFVHSLRRR
jgi:hypothetical protein